TVPAARLAELAGDQHFMRRLTEVSEDLRQYLGCRWRPLSVRATRSGRQPRRRPANTLASVLHHRTVMRVLPPGGNPLPGAPVS
ncbi:hypothetical protein ABZ737_31900, partial [Streptomyces sp. NPDC013087]|uniref:hypothetical protein n=1 Tax=Streptomyces sp. NPDC013087 TaxID=3156694 RepID=UPI003400A81B